MARSAMLGWLTASGLAACGRPDNEPIAAGSTGQSDGSSGHGGGSTFFASSSSGDLGADSTDGGTGEGGQFVVHPDGLSSPFECDLWVEGCPRGDKCMPWATDGGGWNATRCSPVVRRPAGVGEPCQVIGELRGGVDTCDAGSLCWPASATTLEGRCTAFCIGGPEYPTCADPCSVCSGSAVPTCNRLCDPIAQDCAPNEGCYVSSSGQPLCLLDLSGDLGGHGDPCSATNTCDPGTVCAAASTFPRGSCPPDTASCCQTLCAPGQANACPGAELGVECLPLVEIPRMPACGLLPAAVGSCRLPAGGG